MYTLIYIYVNQIEEKIFKHLLCNHENNLTEVKKKKLFLK